MQPGYDTEHILAMTVTTMERAEVDGFHRQALERVAALPGVTRAAFAWGVPLTGNKWPGDVDFPGLPGVSTAGDRVNRAAAIDHAGLLRRDGDQARRRPGVSANRRTHRTRREWPSSTKRWPSATIAGRNPLAGDSALPAVPTSRSNRRVVADTRTEDLSQTAEPEIYLPFWQSGAFSKHLVVRTTGPPLALAQDVRREIRAVDSTSAVERITTMAEIRRESMASQIFAMRLLAGFAIAATLLALVGLYGVLSLSVGAGPRRLPCARQSARRGGKL